MSLHVTRFAWWCFLQVIAYDIPEDRHACSKDLIKRKINQGTVKPQKTEQWLGYKIRVPALQPTNLGYCNIISIKYYVIVSIVCQTVNLLLYIFFSLLVANWPCTIVTLYNSYLLPRPIVSRQVVFVCVLLFLQIHSWLCVQRFAGMTSRRG